MIYVWEISRLQLEKSSTALQLSWQNWSNGDTNPRKNYST